jgi:hypothetical protein
MFVCAYQTLINEVLPEHRRGRRYEFFVEMDGRVRTTGRSGPGTVIKLSA